MLDVLAIVAHPDDAELLCGGTLLRAADAGQRTGVLDLTAGEMGSSGTRETRAHEAAAASEILGLAIRRCANLPDGALEDVPEARYIVATHIRELRPKVVILHWPEARHPDHAAASRLGHTASFLAGLRNAPIPGEPFRPFKVLYTMSYQETTTPPTFMVDITEQMQRKLDAIFAFGTQFDARIAMGDVIGGATRPLRDQILAHHAHYGSLIRRDYAEPFYCREAMAVEDIGGLTVRTF